MTFPRVPLGVLDLVPVSSGSTPSRALRNSIDLVRTAEALGYSRYWFAEHHLNPGVAGSSPPLLISMAAAATDRIRVGSGGVQSGHRTALSVVEEFGLLDAMHPGRIDLGIGRSGGRNFFRDRLAAASRASQRDRPPPEPRHTENGLLVPAPPSLRGLAKAPRVVLTADLLQQRNAESADYGQLMEDILGLLRGSYRSADVVVAPDDASAKRLAAGYALWVRSIRRGEGAIPFPGPDQAGRHTWDDDDRALVRDRVDTQFVGSPKTVASDLVRLQEATDADELIVTTITHSHADRMSSFALLAREWFSDHHQQGNRTMGVVHR